MSATRRRFTSIAEDTVLIPQIIADGVMQEAAIATGFEMPASYGEYLCDRAETIYRHNDDFANRVNGKGDTGRDLLYAFMRHWLAAKLKQDQPPLFDRLPPGFANGEEPPDMHPPIVERFPHMAPALRPIAAEAETLDLAMSNFNSGAKRNPSNGIRFFKSEGAAAYVDHFAGNHLVHCNSASEAMAFLIGYKAGRDSVPPFNCGGDPEDLPADIPPYNGPMIVYGDAGPDDGDAPPYNGPRITGR